MENYLMFEYAMITMPDIDMDDVRFGQTGHRHGRRPVWATSRTCRGSINRRVRPPCCVYLLTRGRCCRASACPLAGPFMRR